MLWQLKGVLYVVQTEENSLSTEEEHILEDMQDILNEFSLVFDIPKELTPTRVCDHKIPLICPNHLVCARPYRYPFTIKMK